MRFQGDLIITDPGYVARDAEDWKACGYGDHMQTLGLTHVLPVLVTEGELDFEAVNPTTGESYGTFVTDSGVAAAMLLEEVLAYNPEFDEHTECPENVVWIPGFHGEITAHGTGEEQWLEGEGNFPFTTEEQ